MKRKVIQIANSTQLISLPRAWAKRNNVQKGQELDIREDGKTVVITSGDSQIIEKAEVDISSLGDMAQRAIRALYKRGIDELKVSYSTPELLVRVQDAINKDVVGFEILEQGSNYCIIKNVSGNIEEFDSVLRRTFLLLLSMADESLNAIKAKDYERLRNIAFLEQANNRFTMICRRSLNKNGNASHNKVGPLYYIVEGMENIGDQYKYLCNYFDGFGDKNAKIRKEFLGLYEKSNNMVRTFYEIFYKLDEEKVAGMKKARNAIVDDVHHLLKKHPTPNESMLLHFSLTIAQQVFNLMGPYFVLNL